MTVSALARMVRLGERAVMKISAMEDNRSLCSNNAIGRCNISSVYRDLPEPHVYLLSTQLQSKIIRLLQTLYIN